MQILQAFLNGPIQPLPLYDDIQRVYSFWTKEHLIYAVFHTNPKFAHFEMLFLLTFAAKDSEYKKIFRRKKTYRRRVIPNFIVNYQINKSK